MKARAAAEEAQTEGFPIPPAQFATNLAALLKTVGLESLLSLLSSSTAEIKLRNYDNWNGGTYFWSLVFRVDMESFAKLTQDEKSKFEKTLTTQASRLLEEFENNHIEQTLIAPHLLPAEAPPSPSYDPIKGFITREQFFKARELDFVKSLDNGGFAEVVLVKRRHLDTMLAAKFFDPHPFNALTEERRAKARDRLLREGSLLASIRHSNVVRLFDCTLVAGDPVLILEYINGVTLDSIRQERGPLSAHEAIGYICQVLDALSECHAQGIVHRDVAPKNVVVEKSGRAVLIDFGLGFSEECLSGPRLTTQPIGTPGFVAPELDSEPLRAEATVDIFAAGALAVFLLTGRPPQLGTRLEIPEAEAPLITLLQRAVEPNPVQRIGSARELSDSLRACIRTDETPLTVAPAFGVLREDDIRELLGLEDHKATNPAISTLLAQFNSATSRLFSGKGNREAGLATLLTTARRQVDTYLSSQEPENRCDSIKLENTLSLMLATLSGSFHKPSTATVKAAFEQSVTHGWIEEDKYDSWRPGMQSGSGWRKCHYPTSLGRNWLKTQVGFDPPQKLHRPQLFTKLN